MRDMQLSPTKFPNAPAGVCCIPQAEPNTILWRLQAAWHGFDAAFIALIATLAPRSAKFGGWTPLYLAECRDCR
jgi:hypothetical protein